MKSKGFSRNLHTAIDILTLGAQNEDREFKKKIKTCSIADMFQQNGPRRTKATQ